MFHPFPGQQCAFPPPTQPRHHLTSLLPWVCLQLLSSVTSRLEKLLEAEESVNLEDLKEQMGLMLNSASSPSTARSGEAVSSASVLAAAAPAAEASAGVAADVAAFAAAAAEAANAAAAKAAEEAAAAAPPAAEAEQSGAEREASEMSATAAAAAAEGEGSSAALAGGAAAEAAAGAEASGSAAVVAPGDEASTLTTGTAGAYGCGGVTWVLVTAGGCDSPKQRC